MNKDSKKITNMFLRYISIMILGISNLYIIYKILTPLTIHATNLSLKIFTPTILIENTIRFNQTTIQIVSPCVAGSAFYLLLTLILSTANIGPTTRLKAILTAISTFFILNIARILILAQITNSANFELIHWIFWHIISTVFVVATYIATVKFYKIKSIPIYSDLKYMRRLIVPKRKHRRSTKKRKHHSLF